MLSGLRFTQFAAVADRPDAARLAVRAIILFVGLLFVLRLVLSANLEIDEAQFVGAVDLRLFYGNSHPPLYNWLVRAMLELTGWRWALSVALVRAMLLLATFLLLFDAGRRLGGNACGILALAVAALCPQVSWMSAHTLAHSVLAMAAAVGILHGLVLAVRGGRPAGWALIGLWAGIGLLAKYNIGLLIAPLAIAVALEPELRRAIAGAKGPALLGAGLFAAAAGLTIAGVASAPTEAAERIAKLYRDSAFGAVDLPFIGIDGAIALVVAVAAWGAIAVALLFAARRTEPADPVMARVLWRTLSIGTGGFLFFVLAADMSAVHERYLTPLFMALPLLAALHLVRVPWRGLVMAAGALAFVAVPIGIVGMTLFDTHRFARPYDALAMPIAASAPQGTLEVRSQASDLAANIVVSLRRLGRDAALATDRLASDRLASRSAIVEIDPASWPMPPQPDEGFCLDVPLEIGAPYDNFTGRMMSVNASIYTPAACHKGGTGN